MIDLIKRFGKEFIITRQTAGSYNDAGDFVEGFNSSITIQASAQPVSARERELLPEGTRQREMFKLYTTTQLHSNRGPNTRGDIVTINGEKFEITGCQDYTTHNSPSNKIRYYKAQAERMEDQS